LEIDFPVRSVYHPLEGVLRSAANSNERDEISVSGGKRVILNQWHQVREIYGKDIHPETCTQAVKYFCYPLFRFSWK
jgi:hypothetical protein